MTTLIVVDGNRGETRSKAVARRLREELAGRQISVAEVARRLHVTQQKLSRRMTGLTPWDVDELDEVCRAAGISFVYVTTGIRALPQPDGPPGGGDGDGLPIPFADDELSARRTNQAVGDHHWYSPAQEPETDREGWVRPAA